MGLGLNFISPFYSLNVMIAKWLTGIGLFLEFLYVFLIIRDNLFLNYEKYISTLGKGTYSDINKLKRESRIVIGFLTFGMLLQGIALFV